MKIERSTAVQAQLTEATALRITLIEQLTQALDVGPAKKKSKKKEPKNPFLHNIELSAEGFQPVMSAVPVSKLERTSSMLVGPLFTSIEYPIPSTAKGMMLPVVQLNLVEISSLSGQDFGDGLLQLWCDPDWANSSRGFVRVLPRADVESQAITPFDYEPHPGASSSPLPSELIFDPTAVDVDVITGYESMGLQCQTNYFDVYCEDVPDDVFESLSDDLERFQELIATKNKLHVLGSFYPIQYSAVDIEWNCLMHFPSWGSSGNAQIFYRLTDDGMAFRFEESLR